MRHLVRIQKLRVLRQLETFLPTHKVSGTLRHTTAGCDSSTRAVTTAAAGGSSNLRHFTEANESFQLNFSAGQAPVPPARQVAVVTCMDARLHPERFLGLAIGDAHVIRNAGGRVSDDALRSLVISQRLLGTKEVVIIHHTECGMEGFENEDLYNKVKTDLGQEAHQQVLGKDFLPFKGLEESVRTDVKAVQAHKAIAPDTHVHGFVYDVKDGKLTAVH